MKHTLQGVDRISGVAGHFIESFAALVRELAGENAKALTFFGACVGGASDTLQQGVHSVLVLHSIDFGFLRRLAEKGESFGKSRIVAPLIMTPSFIQASCDTFAVELIEIQQRHVTVFGDDYFDQLRFEDHHVRLQCERELKVALLSLRHGLLATTGRETALGRIVETAVENLTRTLRGLIWLKGVREARPAKEVISEVEKICGQELSGLKDALNRAHAPTWSSYENLYRDVEVVKQFVDAWK